MRKADIPLHFYGLGVAGAPHKAEAGPGTAVISTDATQKRKVVNLFFSFPTYSFVASPTTSLPRSALLRDYDDGGVGILIGNILD